MSDLKLHDIDFQEFIKAVDQCKGQVFLVTNEGDKLNLKSKFCQIIGLTKIIHGGMVTEAKLVCENPEDESLLFRFNLYGDQELSK